MFQPQQHCLPCSTRSSSVAIPRSATGNMKTMCWADCSNTERAMGKSIPFSYTSDAYHRIGVWATSFGRKSMITLLRRQKHCSLVMLMHQRWYSACPMNCWKFPAMKRDNLSRISADMHHAYSAISTPAAVSRPLCSRSIQRHQSTGRFYPRI